MRRFRQSTGCRHDNPRPNFVQVDFGLARNASGELEPKLVELQAFPSIYGYQEILCEEYVRAYGLGEELGWRFGGLDSDGYWDVLRRAIVGEHAPENVVLTEVEPDEQKTRPDFNVYADRLGVRTVDIAKLRKEGNRLFYEREEGRGQVEVGADRSAFTTARDRGRDRAQGNSSGLRLSRRTQGRMGGSAELVFSRQQVFFTVSF